jgi:pyruvate formate lyase activating enzyme
MRLFAKGWSSGFDGPGRRLVLYLKGCNFNCLWCANPESISPDPEMLFYPNRSEYAATCCDKGAVRGRELHRPTCAGCAAKPCLNLWRNPAFELAGTEMTVREVIETVVSSRAMFGRAGGVTFGGGEPTLQLDELLAAATRLKQLGIHTALETNGSSPRFPELFGAFDLIICDLKCVSADLHRDITGASNEHVLENIAGSVAAGVNLIVRMPVIAELNFTPDERERVFRFLHRVRPPAMEFLRLHHLGLPKYEALGHTYGATNLHPPAETAVEEYCARLTAIGINANSGDVR